MATVSKNEERDGIEITFPEKPLKEMINWLKEHKYRFTPTGKKWYKKFTLPDFEEATKYFA